MKRVFFALLALSFAGPVSGECRVPRFSRLGTYGIAMQPYQVVAADFDGDRHVDLFVTGATSAFMKGLGDGHVGAALPVPLAGQTRATVADFDGDGHLDVATAGDRIAILFGRGDGSFDVVPLSAGGFSFTSITTADLNEDGTLDLVLTDLQGRLTVVPGAGAGTFSGPVTEQTAMTRAFSAAVADLDGDGHLDLAIAGLSRWSLTKPPDALVEVRLGEGGLVPGPRGVIVEQFVPVTVLAGDLDRDGRTDLVYASAEGRVTLLPGTEGRLLGPPYTTDVPGGITAAVLVDLNSDEQEDLVLAGWNGVNVLANNGMRMRPVGAYQAGGSPSDVTAADLDGDGVVDLIVTNNASNDVTIFLGRCDEERKPGRGDRLEP